jgi:hypothetical protein
MASPTTHPIWYVYGIVPADTPMASPPAGIDDSRVSLEQHAGVAALVSVLDDPGYSPAEIEANSGNVEWLSPRAVAHDRVLTWASDHGAVVPLPMFSLFSGDEALRQMLDDRASQLNATLARVGRGREYALRVYRVDAELLSAVASLSPRLATMASAAAGASPGQRYLLERKLDGERKSEMRAVTQRIVEEIVDSLSPHTIGVRRSPIPKAADADAAARGTMVLNAAFLIAPASLESFQRMLTSLVERHGPHGLRFDFTGPWPPYHFVNEASEDG